MVGTGEVLDLGVECILKESDKEFVRNLLDEFEREYAENEGKGG